MYSAKIGPGVIYQILMLFAVALTKKTALWCADAQSLWTPRHHGELEVLILSYLSARISRALYFVCPSATGSGPQPALRAYPTHLRTLVVFKCHKMSLSTTSTATYVLLKYSRSYPPPSQLTGPSQQSQSQQPSGEDWQHFTNPVIKLTLDIKKRATGELDAYRLRIVWSLNGTAEPDAMDVDQRDVVFVSGSRFTICNETEELFTGRFGIADFLQNACLSCASSDSGSTSEGSLQRWHSWHPLSTPSCGSSWVRTCTS